MITPIQTSGRYFVIEGPIGVGKTSLSTLLAERMNARLVHERADENPFLEDFYKDTERYRFHAQMFFLMNRFNQQQDLFPQHDRRDKVTISDYLFAKDRVFAYLNLDEKELKLYEQYYAELDSSVVKPDLVIFLQADVDTLLKRIKQRGRSYEKEINQDYIVAVHEAYNRFFFRYTETPLLVVNTSEIDFVHRQEDLDDLIHEIMGVQYGTQYYVPVSKK